jgi:YrbI family 3-deoxy-D-manno-octulosonate 8-phosphate phosphatase
MQKSTSLSYKMPSIKIQKICKKIKLIVSDFDGVMTDNKVWINSTGEEAVACSRADGWAVNILRELKIHVACLTSEPSKVVSARCQKIKINYYNAPEDKGVILKNVVAKDFKVSLEEIAFVGNDTNDLPAMTICALPIAPADAAPEIIKIAKWHTISKGGEGVLREVAWAFSEIITKQ